MESDCDIPTKHIAVDSGFKYISDITEERLQLIKNEKASFKFKVIRSNADVSLQIKTDINNEIYS